MGSSARCGNDRTPRARYRRRQNRITVGDTRAHRQRCNGFGGEREAIGEIVAIPADQTDGAALPIGKDTKAVALDLVNPAGTHRRLFGRARQTRLETGMIVLSGNRRRTRALRTLFSLGTKIGLALRKASLKDMENDF
jgi:hypothetical protein